MHPTCAWIWFIRVFSLIGDTSRSLNQTLRIVHSIDAGVDTGDDLLCSILPIQHLVLQIHTLCRSTYANSQETYTNTGPKRAARTTYSVQC